MSKAFRAAPASDVTGTNGARSGDDIVRFVLSGAQAVEVVTSVWLEGPQVIGRLLDEVRARLVANRVAAVGDIVGASVAMAREYSELSPLPGAEPAWRAWGPERWAADQ